MSNVKDIPFNAEQSGLDELAGATPFFTNALVDKANVVRARPGITAWGDFPVDAPSTRPVTSMATFGDSLIYTTDDGRVFAWTGGHVAQLSLGGGVDTIDGALRPVSASKGSTIFVLAAGGAPQKVTPGLVSDRLGGSPPNSNGVVIIARRIVFCAADTGVFFWSGVLDIDFEFYDTGIEFREAEARADNLVTLSAAARELYAFGEETVEAYMPDENETFSPVAAIEAGLGASRSVFRWHGLHAWLDDRRQFVLSDCHSFDENSIISSEIQNQVDKLATVADTWGFRLKLGPHDLLTWVMPTEGRVFAYDQTTKGWSQWYGWTAGRLGPWAPTSFFFWRERGLHLVGLANGQIAQLSFSAYTDLGDPIFWRARTGFVDHGVSQRKAPLMAHFQFRRGEAQSEESAVDITWRDDLGGFQPALRQTLGTAGDVEPTVEVCPVGASYRQREWQVSSTAEDAIAMTAARETFDVLEGVG